MHIDLNCDLGESFGAYRIGDDAGVLPYVTSANVACGAHAGDPAVMRSTVAAALEHGVAIGAHPGLPDLAGFGRREMKIAPQEAYDLVVYQVGALAGFAAAAGTFLRHVKPHGALYNMACRDAALAEPIARAVRDVDARLILFGLPGSELQRAADGAGIRFAREAFADRAYAADGSLVPRGTPGAVVEDADEAVRRAVGIASEGRVRTVEGGELRLAADTLCVHGDRADAARFARALREGLERAGVRVAAPEGR
ncbi:MAG TPA: 5-oxoprolinase subunit PxpA [Longimicrobium sp.]|nr:5-oxoprolinase subunit PxpA [Longimicrobium sp.]